MREVFNSCRNWRCPKCGAIDKEKWIIYREQDFHYKKIHMIFTIPFSLNILFINNQREIYNLLFTTAWELLSDFGNKKNTLAENLEQPLSYTLDVSFFPECSPYYSTVISIFTTLKAFSISLSPLGIK